MRSHFVWTLPRMEALTELWPDHSASYIAATLGDGCTRNSVIGKANRLGLPKKKAGGTAGRKPQSAKIAKIRLRPYVTRPKIKPQPVDITLAVRFPDLRDWHCHYVLGEPAGVNTLYCGNPRDAGHSYCQAHCIVMFNGLWCPSTIDERHRAARARQAKLKKARLDNSHI